MKHTLLTTSIFLYIIFLVIRLTHHTPTIAPDEPTYLHGHDTLLAATIHYLIPHSYIAFLAVNTAIYLATIHLTTRVSREDAIYTALHPSFFGWGVFAMMEPLAILSITATHAAIERKLHPITALIFTLIGRTQTLSNIPALLATQRKKEILLIAHATAYIIAHTQISPHAIFSLRYLLLLLTALSLSYPKLKKIIVVLTPFCILEAHTLMHAVELCTESTTEYCEILNDGKIF